jgi:hypothetical protein
MDHAFRKQAGRYGRHHGHNRCSQGRKASLGHPKALSTDPRGLYEPVRTDGMQTMSLDLSAEVKQRQEVRQRWRTEFPGTYSARGAGAMAVHRVAGAQAAARARGRARARCAGLNKPSQSLDTLRQQINHQKRFRVSIDFFVFQGFRFVGQGVSPQN